MLLNKVCGLVVYTLPREKGGGGGGGGGAVINYFKGGSGRDEFTISKTSLKDAIISLRGRGLDSF